MKLNDILARLPLWFESGDCYVLEGPPGIGKTDTIALAPEIIKKKTNKHLGLVIVNGGNLSPGDTVGFGIPKHERVSYQEGPRTGEATDRSIMVFTNPFFWKTDKSSIDEGGKYLEDYPDGGIIFIDEFDKADVDIKKVLGEGAHSGRFGPHRLPPNWVVWMAGNTAEHRSGSTKNLDHLINRQCIIPVTPDLASWVDWAERNNVRASTITFASKNPQVVWADKMPDKQGPYCTARSLVKADRYIQLLLKHGMPIDDGSALYEIAGRIGQSATGQMMSFIRLEGEVPDYADVIANPMTAKVSEKVDAQMLTAYTLAHTVLAKDAENVIKYINRLNKEFASTFARAAVKRDFKLAMVPAFNKWAMSNAHLMNEINRA
jgi:MoxR-like ATPase